MDPVPQSRVIVMSFPGLALVMESPVSPLGSPLSTEIFDFYITSATLRAGSQEGVS